MNNRSHAIRVVVIFFLCILVGLGIVIQARTTEGLHVYVSATSIDDYIVNIETEKGEIENLKTLIAQAQAELRQHEEIGMGNREEYHRLLELRRQELESYKLMAGYSAARGPGIRIIMKDGTRALYPGENLNNVLVHDRQIIQVVNELRRCGAEAISINGQRVAGRTSINCSGYTIRINGTTYAPPFVISAIGNFGRMQAALGGSLGYGTLLRESGVYFQMEKVEDMVIPAYEGLPWNKYMMDTKTAGAKDIKEGKKI